MRGCPRQETPLAWEACAGAGRGAAVNRPLDRSLSGLAGGSLQILNMTQRPSPYAVLDTSRETEYQTLFTVDSSKGQQITYKRE